MQSNIHSEMKQKQTQEHEQKRKENNAKLIYAFDVFVYKASVVIPHAFLPETR